MNHLIFMAGVFAALAAFWSMPPVREYATGWLPNPLDDLADSWGGAVLSVLVVVLFFCGLPKAASGGGAIAGPPPAPPPAIGRAIEAAPTPPAQSGPFLPGRVVARDASGKLNPVTTGTARIGQNSSDLTEAGAFQVSLPDSPQPDTLVEIEATHYLSRFLRLDDQTFAQRKPIELLPKRRILVIPMKASDRNTADEEIRRSLENEMGSGQLDLLSDDKLRDEVLNRLYTYQQSDALYDPKTLARVGNFEGATDGVFWSLTRGSSSFSLECRLVNLTTAKMEYTVNPSFPQGTPMAAAAEATADLLLSRMATARILSPKDTAEVKRNISVRGYSVHIPASWTLWIGVLPEGNDRLFPQRRLSSHGDQSFYAPDVYAGPEGVPSQPMRFELYTVLAAPEYSQAIEAYIASGAQDGLGANAWNKERFKILDHIAVVRRK
jgi:hypothetical protein